MRGRGTRRVKHARCCGRRRTGKAQQASARPAGDREAGSARRGQPKQRVARSSGQRRGRTSTGSKMQADASWKVSINEQRTRRGRAGRHGRACQAVPLRHQHGRACQAVPLRHQHGHALGATPPPHCAGTACSARRRSSRCSVSSLYRSCRIWGIYTMKLQRFISNPGNGCAAQNSGNDRRFAACPNKAGRQLLRACTTAGRVAAAAHVCRRPPSSALPKERPAGPTHLQVALPRQLRRHQRLQALDAVGRGALLVLMERPDTREEGGGSDGQVSTQQDVARHCHPCLVELSRESCAGRRRRPPASQPSAAAAAHLKHSSSVSAARSACHASSASPRSFSWRAPRPPVTSPTWIGV